MLRIRDKRLNMNTGFTLIEMLVGVFIFTIIAIGLIALVSNVFVSSNKQSVLLADQDQARKQAFSIINQLRNAQTSSTGAYPLEKADAQDLRFYSDIDNDTLVERVRYFVQNGKLYQGIIKPSGSPLTYNPANEQASVAQNNLANGASPLFYYYDGSFDGSVDNYLSQPVSVLDVKFIKLDLKVYNTAGARNNNFFTVTAGGAIRNLKTNLGEGPEGIGAEYRLTTQTSPVNAGSVAVSPMGPLYPEETLVNLNAYANLGYGFSSWDGNVNDPASQATTIVMKNDNVVTANFTAIPQTLVGSIYNKSGSQLSNRKWTLRIRNNSSHFVNDVSLYSFSLTYTSGTFCTPTLISPTEFPAFVGDINSGSNRNYDVRINFSGCSSSSRFTANFTFAGNNGADWGSATITNQAP